MGGYSVSVRSHPLVPVSPPGPMTREKPISQGYGPIRSHRHTESELPWPRREWRPRHAVAIHGPANRILEKDFIFVYGLVCMVWWCTFDK